LHSKHRKAVSAIGDNEVWPLRVNRHSVAQGEPGYLGALTVV